MLESSYFLVVILAGKLSESEGDEDQSREETLEDVQPQYIDESAQDFDAATQGVSGGAGEWSTSGMGLQMEDEEISFDPTEFFMNSALASAAGASGTDINNDLQVSDSDEDGDEKDEAPLIPTENQNNEGFDIDEYL